jgi:hypothetical protein
MRKRITLIILISILIGLYNIHELIACIRCCGKECVLYEETHKTKLTKTECDKIINHCYNWWNEGFIKARINKMKQIDKPPINNKANENLHESYSLSVEQFIDEYYEGKEITEKKYKNQILKISGKIVDLYPKENIISISYGDLYSIDTVTCNDVENDILNKLKINSEIKIKGLFESIYEAGPNRVKIFYFTRCIIEK